MNIHGNRERKPLTLARWGESIIGKRLALQGRVFCRWLMPIACLLCDQNSPEMLCCACQEALPWLPTACHRCANPLQHVSVTDQMPILCGHCLRNPPPHDSTFALFYYQFPINRIISLLKFYDKLKFAKLLATLLAEKIVAHHPPPSRPELIIPMPLHRHRLKARGYNHAVELARPLAKKLNIPLSLTSCVRVINTKPQSSMPATERKSNVKNAFAVYLPKSVKHVAIVDDVVTTGSTVAELARLLKKSGVEVVEVWCCARTCM